MAIDCVVIGAGMAGVTAARELVSAGMSVVVLEARDRIGGRIWSIRDFCAAPVEAGAEFIHGIDALTWADVHGAGLAVRACPQTRGTMFNLGGRTRWLPWALLHPGVWPSFPILGLLRRARPPDMSAREFIDRYRFRGRARRLVEMVLTAHLPGSLDEVGILGLLDDNVLRLETGLNHRVDAGYDSLPGYIAQGLDVRHGCRVETIEWGGEQVLVRCQGGTEISARTVVSTLPVGVLRQRRVRFEPELPESKRDALDRIVMGPVSKILLEFERPFWPDWLALLPCPDGPLTLYWPVFYGAGDSRPAVLTAYATGPRAARLSVLADEAAARTCTRDLERLFPRSGADRLLRAWRRVDWAADELACGGYTFLGPGGRGARERLAAADTGHLYWAGSATVSAPIAATVEGAFASGLRAAALVAERLGAAGPAATDAAGP